MKIAFLVNSIASCNERDTTLGLGRSAAHRGHDVYFFTVGDGTYYQTGHIAIRAIHLKGKFKSAADFLSKLQSSKAKIEKVTSEELDVIYLRNDTSADLDRPWAKFAGILLGQAAAKNGVLVLNNPDTLAYAHVDKMYFEQFPKAIRPASIITREVEEIRAFYEEHNQKMVLKPLEGSGGKDVFMVTEKEKNLKQIVETITRNGYVIAQEYLPEAKNGDVRLFMMNGKPMEYKGKYAAFRRVNDADFRTNMHAGGRAEKFEMTDKMLEIADILRPKLIKDGIFCAGLDIVGDKLIELNITSPGGMVALTEMAKVDFHEAMIVAIERKLMYKKNYNGAISNRELCVLE